MSVIIDIFEQCINAIRDGVLIRQMSRSDKEFHFQNWFRDRLNAIAVNFDPPGRNSYPDFTLVRHTEGYEIKGLAWPGREASYDCNSQVPTGFHNGRDIYYVFGRYPANAGTEYPVIDLVICHGDFLNANHDYIHRNRHVRGFGSYGDIMIRDRKMYVAPTPFAVADGLTGMKPLILPADTNVDRRRLRQVGILNRAECAEIVVGYSFDLTNNEIETERILNPNAGTIHNFIAYRHISDTTAGVSLRANVITDDNDE